MPVRLEVALLTVINSGGIGHHLRERGFCTSPSVYCCCMLFIESSSGLRDDDICVLGSGVETPCDHLEQGCQSLTSDLIHPLQAFSFGVHGNRGTSFDQERSQISGIFSLHCL